MRVYENCRPLQTLGTGLFVVLASILLSACDLTSSGKHSATAGSTATPVPTAAATPTTSPGTTPTTTPVATPSNATGSATVTWLPPQQNADGSALTDMAGFRIYYGNSADELSKVVNISTVGISRYVIDNLAAGTWYFAVAAFNTAGIEGPLSNVAGKTIG
jgi:Fibronectin type III domain